VISWSGTKKVVSQWEQMAGGHDVWVVLLAISQQIYIDVK